MRQRNNGPYTLVVPSIPAEVLPGDVIDYPDPITGLDPVDDPPPVSEPDPEPAADPPTTTGRRGNKPKPEQTEKEA